MKAATENIRTKVDMRQVIQYLKLRQRILQNKFESPTNDSSESTDAYKLRCKEITTINDLINRDTIDKKIRGMHQYIHRQNEYLEGLKNDANEKEGVENE